MPEILQRLALLNELSHPFPENANVIRLSSDAPAVQTLRRAEGRGRRLMRVCVVVEELTVLTKVGVIISAPLQGRADAPKPNGMAATK